MKRIFQIVVLVLLTVVLANCGSDSSSQPGAGASTPDFLSWTGTGDSAHYFKLVRVNGKTGEVTTIGGLDYFPAIVYGPDGTLYGISDDLNIINPQDGSTTLIGKFQYSAANVVMMSAAFSPDGVLYVMENADPNRVFTVNLTNGALTYVGTPQEVIMDMKFASNGTLYAAFSSLYTLNPSNMSTLTTVGSTGGKLLNALAFDSNGTLYGVNIYPASHIYSIDLSTGMTTTVVPVNSIALQALVVERPSAATASKFSKAAGTNDLSVSRPLETLLNLEKEIKSARQTLRK